jgi:hypothetical protein
VLEPLARAGGGPPELRQLLIDALEAAGDLQRAAQLRARRP